MTKQEFRLEILKLIHRHDHTPDQILMRAQELEDWVLESKGEISAGENGTDKRSPGRPKKHGNADPSQLAP